VPLAAATLDQFDQLGLPALWSQEERNPVIQLRLRDSMSGVEWYVIEGTRQPNDYRFYGFRVQGLPIRCHFLLSDLRCHRFDLDMSPKGKRWSEVRVST
jgi:hypothetical protein